MSLLGIVDKQISFILSLGDRAIDKRIRFDINVTRKPQVSSYYCFGALLAVKV